MAAYSDSMTSELLIAAEEAVSATEAAAAALDVDYAGIDLLLCPDGEWRVIEVNGIPAWWGLTQATGADVTGALVEAFMARLN